MITQTVTYTNFDGDEITETAMFHLSASDLMDLIVELGILTDHVKRSEEALTKAMDRYISSQNPKGILNFFKTVIRMSYGVRTEDGRSFIKNEDTTARFMGSPAYDEIFLTLLRDETLAANFFNALVPEHTIKAAAKLSEGHVKRS